MDLDTAENGDDQVFLSAVHYLVQNPGKADATDLLLAAIMHSLDERSLRVADLSDRVKKIWPASATGADDILDALKVGRELGLVVESPNLQGTDEWMLTQSGANDVARHRAWAQQLRTQSAKQLAERAKDALGIELSTEQASLWLHALTKALVAGVQHAQDAYHGNIEQLVTGSVRPRGIDRDAVLEAINDHEGDRGEFLRACALAAIDPIDPFGNEIISYITTGCILHSVVAQSARARVKHELGSAVGERAFLDTPCLMALLHVERVSAPMSLAIKTAVAQGWEVQVLEHSLEELREVLERSARELPTAFKSARERGARDDWLATLIDDQVTSMLIEGLQSGLYPDVRSFGSAASRLDRILADLGVTIRPASNYNRTEVTRFADALKESLGERGARSSVVIDRDAETMAAARRRRARQPQQRGNSKWPGCWVITTDRHMGRAYATVTRTSVILTLTPSQWTKLLAAFSDPIGVVDLAVASADQWIEEAMWTIPVRFPAEMAAALAASLSPQAGGSSTDLRVAQLTLADALEATDATGASLASNVLERRTKRLHNSMSIRLEEAEGRAEEDRLARLEAEMKRAQAELAARRASDEAGAASREKGELEATLAWERTKQRRILISSVLAVIGAATLTATVFLSPKWLIVVAVLSLGFFVYASFVWCTRRDAKLIPTLLGGALQVGTTVVTVADLLDLLPERLG